MKTKELWQTLYGNYVLTFQADTYILNEEPYTIDYFMKLNKSYIGGNMYYIWDEFKRQNINIPYQSFNGGLSLRKRLDMIKVIEKYIPESTVYPSHNMQSDAEDVYFTVGCYNMGFKIGDDEPSQHLSLHCIFYEKFFGCHNPVEEIEQLILNTYPNINKNKYIFKQTFKRQNKDKQQTSILKNPIKIEYGISDCRIDVTNEALKICKFNEFNFTVKNYILIPQLDYERSQIFSDPIFGTIKSIFINNIEYIDNSNIIYLNLLDNLVTTENPVTKLKSICFEWTSEKNDVSLNCLNYLYKLGFRMFFIQFTDDYTFKPNEYYNIDNTKQILINNTIKCMKGLVWCK